MGPTNPSEEHFKGGLWGWVTSAWVKLVATAGGLLKVQIGGQDADVEVKQQAPADLTPGVYGWTGAAWIKLYTTAAGALRVQLQGQEMDVEVKQQTPADLMPGVHGWDGSVWHKLPMVWGYSGLLGEDLDDLNLDAGTNVLEGGAVPAGEIWVVRQVSFFYAGTVPTLVQTYPAGTPGAPVLARQRSPVSTLWYPFPVYQILAGGDYMRAEVQGATAGDDLRFRYSGYKMKIGE